MDHAIAQMCEIAAEDVLLLAEMFLRASISTMDDFLDKEIEAFLTSLTWFMARLMPTRRFRSDSS